MDHDNTPTRSYSDEFPRRVKLSSREIGVAVALTFAAGIQLMSSISSRDSKSGVIDGMEKPISLVQPTRG
jgi:hypothetical protein